MANIKVVDRRASTLPEGPCHPADPRCREHDNVMPADSSPECENYWCGACGSLWDVMTQEWLPPFAASRPA